MAEIDEVEKQTNFYSFAGGYQASFSGSGVIPFSSTENDCNVICGGEINADGTFSAQSRGLFKVFVNVNMNGRSGETHSLFIQLNNNNLAYSKMENHVDAYNNGDGGNVAVKAVDVQLNAGDILRLNHEGSGTLNDIYFSVKAVDVQLNAGDILRLNHEGS